MHSDLYSDDLDSMTNNLRDSTNGSLVTYDETFPPTSRKCNDEEGVLVLWTVKDIWVGEEMFNEYADDFRSRAW